MFEAQIEYEAAQASAEALSGIITKAFEVRKSVLSNSGRSSGETTYMGGYVDGGYEVDAGDDPSNPYQLPDTFYGDDYEEE